MKVRVDLIGNATSLERAFKRGSKSARSFGSSIQGGNLGLAALGAGGPLTVGAAAITAFGISAARSGAKYQDTMQKIVGLSGVAQGKVDHLSKAVLDLAPSVGRSPQELAEALYFITSSGVDASKAMDVLKVSAKAATAGLGETQTVADAVTSVMNAYGPANVSAAQATDVLVATVREGKGEADQFAGVIGNVAAIAAQLGVSFNDVGAALAGETRLGLDPETAATQLNAFFSSLLKTTPAAEAALKKVGLSSKGLRDELKNKGLLATLTTLRLSFKGNTAAMAHAFPNVRALRGILALAGKQAGKTAVIFKHLKHSTGSLNSAFGAVSKDEMFKYNQMMARLSAFKIKAGLWMASILVRSVQGWTRLYRKIKSLTQTFGSWFRTAMLKFALHTVEPFSHLPGRLGAWARRAKKALQEGLGGAKASIEPGVVYSTQKDKDGRSMISKYGLKPEKDKYGRSVVPDGFWERNAAEQRKHGAKAAPDVPDKPTKPKPPKSLADIVPYAARLELARARTVLAKRRALGHELIALTHELAGRLTKADRLAVEQEKTSVLDEISGMDKAVRDRKAAAHKKEIDQEKRHANKMSDARKKAADKAKEAAKKAAEAAKAAAEAMTQAVGEARSEIGDLFSGPVLNPGEKDNKSILGVHTTSKTASVTSLTADLAAQVAQASKLEGDLARLKKRGASKQLINELRAQGVSALPQVEALAKASNPLLKAFEKQFAAREKLAQKIAKMTVHATGPVHVKTPRVVIATGNHTTTIHTQVKVGEKNIAEAVTTHQRKNHRRNSPQRGGRHPGVTAGG